MFKKIAAAGISIALGVACGGGAWAQSWSLYQGYTSLPFIQYAGPAANGAMNYVDGVTGQYMNQAALLNVSMSNAGSPSLLTHQFVMDTGSTGIIVSGDNFKPGPGDVYVGPGQQFYSSSGLLSQGSYYLTNAVIDDKNGNPVATARVTVLLVTNQTCVFTNKGCQPNPNPTNVAYMGVGFNRGDSAIAPPAPYNNINPFTNIVSIASGQQISTLWQGYRVTNAGVILGLDPTTTSNFSFVKLTPNANSNNPSSAWQQAPVTISVGGVSGSGQILPDAGIGYSFLTPPPGASLTTGVCSIGGTGCIVSNTNAKIQIFLPGQITPLPASYSFTLNNPVDSALNPQLVQVVDGPSIFINTGREFYAGFDYLYDPVDGFVGYRWNGNVSSQYGQVTPSVALTGTLSLSNNFSSTLPMYLMGNTTLQEAGTGTINSDISGPGGLTIASGIVNLLGMNTYTGGTIVGSGATLGLGGTLIGNLTVQSGGTFLTTGGYSVAPGATLINAGTFQSFGPALFNQGMLFNSGTLTSALTNVGTAINTGTITGTVTNGGTFVNNGAVVGAVTNNGQLSGSGTLTGAFVNNAVVAPGNSIGTLNVNGSFVQNPTGSYQVQTNGAGQSDLISVTGAPGTATLNGGPVNVVGATGVYAPRTTYSILSATGGVTGTYSGVTSAYPFLQPSLSYGPNNVYLTLQIGGFAAAAQTPTQRAVGAVLDAAAPTASGDFGTVLGSVATASSLQGQGFMTAISGQNYAGFSTALVQNAQLFMTNFANQAGGGTTGGGSRVALAEACDIACDTSAPLWGAWGGGIGGTGTVGASAGTGTVTYTVGGFAAGIDRLVTPSVRAGVAVGYSNGSQWVGGFSGSGLSNTVQAALYGNYSEGAVYLDGLAGYAYSANQMWRTIVVPNLNTRTAQGQTGANQVFGQLEGGYRVDVLQRAQAEAYVTPFARLQAYTGTQNGFTETGAQSLNLTVGSQTTNSLRSVLGAQLGGAMDVGLREKLGLQFKLGWSHEYANTTRPVAATLAGAPGMSFTTYGVSPQRDGVLIGLSGSTAVAEATSVYLRYEGNLSGQDSTHAFTAGLRMTW